MIKYITILPITIYLIWIVSTIGIQKSISETYYQIKYKILFWLSLNITALLFLVSYGLENPNNPKQWFLLVSVIGIGYTTAAARFKDEIVDTYHYIGAMGAYVSGYAFIVALHGWDSLFYIVPSLLLMAIIHLRENKKEKLYQSNKEVYTPYINKSVWWDEIIGLLTIYLAML
jgi:hypothetical protein